MRCTVGIAAKGLQLLNSPCLQGIGNGSAHTRMVLMQVHALQLQGLAVQQETTVGSKLYITQTCCCFVHIRYFTIYLYRGLHLIQIGVGGAPQVRIRNLYPMIGCSRFFGEYRVRESADVCHLSAFGIQHSLLNLI